jgi:hypothetical protein
MQLRDIKREFNFMVYAEGDCISGTRTPYAEALMAESCFHCLINVDSVELSIQPHEQHVNLSLTDASCTGLI